MKSKALQVALKLTAAIVVAYVALMAFNINCMGGHMFYTKPKSTIELSRIKQLTVTVIMYAVDNDGYLPHRFETSEDLRALEPKWFDGDLTPVNPNGGNYLPNRALAGAKLDEIPYADETALVYGSRGFPNGSVVIGFVDGHAKVIQDLERVRFSFGDDESD